jgi:serine/threonine protein kinase
LLKKYDEKCDVWAAGVVLYMMLMKKPPFNGLSEG